MVYRLTRSVDPSAVIEPPSFAEGSMQVPNGKLALSLSKAVEVSSRLCCDKRLFSSAAKGSRSILHPQPPGAKADRLEPAEAGLHHLSWHQRDMGAAPPERHTEPCDGLAPKVASEQAV